MALSCLIFFFLFFSGPFIYIEKKRTKKKRKIPKKSAGIHLNSIPTTSAVIHIWSIRLISVRWDGISWAVELMASIRLDGSRRAYAPSGPEMALAAFTLSPASSSSPGKWSRMSRFVSLAACLDVYGSHLRTLMIIRCSDQLFINLQRRGIRTESIKRRPLQLPRADNRLEESHEAHLNDR